MGKKKEEKNKNNLRIFVPRMFMQVNAYVVKNILLFQNRTQTAVININLRNFINGKLVTCNGHF